MTLRASPQVGARVSVSYLGATIDGVIDQIDEDRQQLLVLTAEGEMITFALNRATGQFLATDPSGARLIFPNRGR